MTYTLTAQGQTVEIRYNLQASSRPARGGRRSRIADFSRASRRRLLEMCNRLETKNVNSKFITLTFSKPPTHTEAKAALRRFFMRLRRRWPAVSLIWRMEYQARGAIHFHLIVFRIPFVPQRLIQGIWTACTREERSIVDIRLIRGHRALISYVAKYLAKVSQPAAGASLDIDAYQHAPPSDDCGRFWGVVNREELPYGILLKGSFADHESAEYIRWSMACESRFRLRRTSGRMLLFCDQPERWLQRLFALMPEAKLILGWCTHEQLDTALSLIPQ